MPRQFRPETLLTIALALAIGTCGGIAASLIGTPMPFLLGAFLFSAVASAGGFSLFGVKPDLPLLLRNTFVAVIGVLIGSGFRPDSFDGLDGILLPLACVALFVAAALGMNYLIFRRLGGYDPTTAFYCSMPGGLIESVVMGEKAGADARSVSLQQFSRISLVITALPFIISLRVGETVGSASGVTFEGAVADWRDWLVLTVCAVAGLYLGKLLRLPAGVIVGPLILSAAAHLVGLTDAAPPFWVIIVAQVVVGTGLGARFAGFKRRQIGKAVGLAVFSVAAMLLLDAAIVAALRTVLDIPFEVLFIGFAPGGVTETALIALSLDANPVFVTTLHVFRIVITVVGCSLAARLLLKKIAPPDRTGGE